jgi:hypothetical protein
MQVRKLGWLVVAGGLPGAALLVSTLLAAQTPAMPGHGATSNGNRPPAVDSVVAPFDSRRANPAVLGDDDGSLLLAQSGGWGNPHDNSSWGGSNNNWHGGGWPVVCQSSNNRRRTCNKPSNQTVRIERQLSNTRCTQGVNWGQNRNQIWVDNGCSARFVPTGNWNGGGGNWNGGGSNNWNRAEVTCESRNFRQNQCNWPSNWGTPQLVQQISQVRCTRDRTWGHNRNRGHIWVTDGCAARFRAR